MEACVFCTLELEPGQRVIFENEHCAFLQMIRPDIQGAGVIVPKRHCETVFDLTEAEWNATYSLLQQAKQWIDEHDKPDGYNIGWNCGVVGGQTLFHTHLHILPRYEDEPFAGKGIRHWYKSEANQRGFKKQLN